MAQVLQLRITENGCLAVENGWLPRSLSLEIGFETPISTAIRLRLSLATGQDELYEYFPFSCWIFSGGAALAIAEFDAPSQSREVEVTLPAPWKGITLQIETELGGVPARLGLGADQRQLALLLSRVVVEPLAPGALAAPSPLLAAPQGLVALHPLRPGGFAAAGARGGDADEADDRGRLKLERLEIGVRDPIFVVGAYRSATSALTWAIGQHPDVFALEETNWIGPLSVSLNGAFRLAAGADRAAFDVYDMSRAEFFAPFAHAVDALNQTASRDRALATHLQRSAGKNSDYDPRIRLVRSRFNPKRRWVDGTPENSGYILSIASLFPTAKFICMIRDPRAVARSLLSMRASVAQGITPETAFEFWESLTQRALEAAVLLGPARMCVVTFEALTEAREETMRAVFAFLNLPDFAPAAAVLEARVNSSFSVPREAGELPSSPRHEEIHQAILAGRRLDALPWRRPFEPDRGHMNDQVSRFTALFTG